TVRCRVPYTVCETIACPVTRTIKVCVPYTECVKRARMVPVTVACEAPKACHEGCSTACCESKTCFLDRLRQRWFASLCSTGCCEDHCRSTHCTTTCNDGCNDYCKEGILQRLLRNRFACDCCDRGCSTGACGSVTSPTPMPEIITPP